MNRSFYQERRDSILVIPVLITSCIASSAFVFNSSDVIKVDGSSIIAPITKLVAAEFKNSNSNSADISLKTSRTGGGFKKFYASETDTNEASRPILLKEMDACKQAKVAYLEIPIRLTSKRDGFIPDTDFNPITIY